MGKTLTVRLDEDLERKLMDRARAMGLTRSEAVREAIRSWVEAEPTSLAERLRRTGLVGRFNLGAGDLATNPKHMEGFGQD
jgi:metal-responsive CopG/Arc/MetJ family transcriptional regulator